MYKKNKKKINHSKTIIVEAQKLETKQPQSLRVYRESKHYLALIRFPAL